jgi:DNA-binding Lrp family transcriptional regulator
MDTHDECERIEMSRRERDRLKVLHGVCQRERSQKEAARLLRLSTRPVRRLVRRLEEQGDQGLIHRRRGRPSNRRLPAELRQQVLAEYQKGWRRDFTGNQGKAAGTMQPTAGRSDVRPYRRE